VRQTSHTITKKTTTATQQSSPILRHHSCHHPHNNKQAIVPPETVCSNLKPQARKALDVTLARCTTNKQANKQTNKIWTRGVVSVPQLSQFYFHKYPLTQVAQKHQLHLHERRTPNPHHSPRDRPCTSRVGLTSGYSSLRTKASRLA
jgi:hypothetical protein